MIRNLGIRTKLVLFVFIFVFLPMTLSGFLLFHNIRSGIIETTKTNALSNANHFRSQLKAFITHHVEFLFMLSVLPEVKTNTDRLTNSVKMEQSAAAIRGVFYSTLLSQPDFEVLFLLHPITGEVLASTNSDAEGMFFNRVPYFSEGKKQTFIYKIHYSLTLEKNILAMASPIIYENELAGVVAVWLNTNELQNIIKTSPPSKKYFVTRANYHLPDMEEAGTKDIFYSGVFTESVKKALKGQTGSGISRNQEGTEVISSYTLLEDLDVALISETPMSTVLAQANREGLWYLFIVVGAAFFVLLMTALIGNHITRPILHLTDTIRDMRKKDFVKEIQAPESGVEVTELAGAFNSAFSRRLAAEDALKKSESRLAEAQQIAHIGNWEYNPQDNTLWWSAEIYRIFGMDPGKRDLSIEAFLKTVHPEDRKMITDQILSRPPYRRDYRILLQDGEMRYIHEQVRMTKDNKGNPTLLWGTAQDITENRKLEEQLLHSQKMEAVGQLAGGVAHDFNNILTAIIGFASILKMKLQDNKAMEKVIDHILSSSERAANLTRSLLAFSRKQIIQIEPLKVNSIIQSSQNLLSRIIGEDIHIHTSLSEEDLTIMADSMQVEQIIMNLATNARDAMPEGGSFFITTERFDMDDDFIMEHQFAEHESYALISASDTGSGMDRETRKRVFEPFFTTKEVGKGSGLGLAMIYGIVKQHNGFINIYSEPGEGSTVKIYLPLTKKAVREKTGMKPSGVMKGSETVLLVEDDPDVREATGAILTEYGYRIIEASDGEDAVRKFMENRECVRLLVIDLVLPGKNGREVYEEIRNIHPDIKHLFISGYSEAKVDKKGVIENGLHFMAKPVKPDELLKKVRGILDEPSN